jgi:regulation of enolase protein 1 (concanavalin A-like superfamily)
MLLRSLVSAVSLCLLTLPYFANAQAPVSDDFNGSSLNTSLWTVSAPAGGTVSVSNGHAQLAVPGGSNHDAFIGGNNSVRILQTISNANFDVAAKFDSSLGHQYEGEGILVVQDSGTYLRFELASNGSQTFITANLDSGGSQTQKISVNAPAFNPSVWMRVTRSGNTWTLSSSTDGVNYTAAGSFSQSFTVSEVGLYAWNYNSNPSSAPALTASVDSFKNLASTTAVPTFTPPSGTTFSTTLSVSIADTTSGATIYYTLDGATPTTSSPTYSGPFTITSTTTVKAFAVANGSSSAVGSATYTFSQATGGPVSDDFNGSSLNTSLWTVSAPAGGTVSVSNGHAQLAVPGGSNHDAFVGGNNSVRILQAISNANFDVAAKFDSSLGHQYEGEGILVVQDSGTYLRFELASNGSQTFLTSNLDSGGGQTQKISVNGPAFNPSVWVRVTRSGNTWTLSSSTDGVSYTAAGSFSQSITVSGVGLYAWNYNGNPSSAPALTASVDSFENVSGGTGPNPPVISNVASNPTASRAVITWTTDIAATSVVNYGTTTAYGSTVSSSSLVTSHSITLSGLKCGTLYDYDVASTSASNLSSTSGNFTFTTSQCSTGGGPVSDNFDQPSLNGSLWTFVNPLGDGVLTMNGTAATLNIPQGTAHDPWTTGNNALRLLQPLSNTTNFQVEARFQSNVEIGNQEEGIMVQQDATHFLRYDVLFNGQNTILFAANVQGGSASVFASNTISVSNAPIVLRLQRNGNQWTGTWSTDGINFNAGVSFTATVNVTAVGPFAGTAGSSGASSPAFTAICDYFFNTASRVLNQDGPPPFQAETVDEKPGNPLVEKTLADIEGVGKLNPVIGLESPSAGLYWYGYPASGNVNNAWQKHTIASSGSFYEDVVPFDVNGDGAIDLIASYAPPGSSSNSIVWFENPRGHGVDPATVSQWTMHTIGTGFGEDVLVLADFDGDGKMDVATSAYIYFQNSPTSWTQIQYADSARGTALLDIGSGKGSINLVTTGSSAPYDVVWYENPRETGGNARTTTWISHTVGAGYPCTPTSCGEGPDVATYSAADLNGDGRMDIVAGQSEGGSGAPPAGGLIWFEAPADRRNGTWVRRTIDASFVYAHAIRVADMDKNGTIDLVTSEQDQSPLRRVSIFFNDGSGNFKQQVISNAEGHNTTVGDIRGTGFLDVLNSGHGFFGAPNPLQIFLNPRGH